MIENKFKLIPETSAKIATHTHTQMKATSLLKITNSIVVDFRESELDEKSKYSKEIIIRMLN